MLWLIPVFVMFGWLTPAIGCLLWCCLSATIQDAYEKGAREGLAKASKEDEEKKTKTKKKKPARRRSLPPARLKGVRIEGGSS